MTDRNEAEKYGVSIIPAVIGKPITHYWRARQVRKLGVGENGGRHGIYIDVFDEDGTPMRGNASTKIAWGWEGQRADETADPKALDKPEGEPMGVVDLYPRAKTWVQIKSDGVASERVTGLTSALPDEGPDVTYGHHSYYIAFQKVRAREDVPPVVVEPPTGEPATEIYLPYLEAIVGSRLNEALDLIMQDFAKMGIQYGESDKGAVG